MVKEEKASNRRFFAHFLKKKCSKKALSRVQIIFFNRDGLFAMILMSHKIFRIF
jgi:hypothetical protein